MHEEETFVDSYRWFGRNRRRLHSKAVRGSGEVEFLHGYEEVVKRYGAEVLNTDVEDVLCG